MAGPAEAMEQETAFLERLSNAERIDLSGDSLEIHSAGAEEPLRFVRVAAEPAD